MILNTKQDYINLLGINPTVAKQELQYLLDNRYAWFNTMVMDEKDTSLVEDETHRFIEEDDGFLYQEYYEDSNAKIFRIGFTVAEVEELINEN